MKLKWAESWGEGGRRVEWGLEMRGEIGGIKWGKGRFCGVLEKFVLWILWKLMDRCQCWRFAKLLEKID
jgi:hypothetical protein